jgi:hypothetical protein
MPPELFSIRHKLPGPSLKTRERIGDSALPSTRRAPTDRRAIPWGGLQPATLVVNGSDPLPAGRAPPYGGPGLAAPSNAAAPTAPSGSNATTNSCCLMANQRAARFSGLFSRETGSETVFRWGPRLCGDVCALTRCEMRRHLRNEGGAEFPWHGSSDDFSNRWELVQANLPLRTEAAFATPRRPQWSGA